MSDYFREYLGEYLLAALALLMIALGVTAIALGFLRSRRRTGRRRPF